MKHQLKQPTGMGIVPFHSAEEAWFWFMTAQEARNDGARFIAGQGRVQRPCEPVDIIRIVDRLYRQRRLLWDHLMVLRHYGRRHLPPDRRRLREMRAHKIWAEALARMEVVLEQKGIVAPLCSVKPNDQPSWFFMEGVAAE